MEKPNSSGGKTVERTNFMKHSIGSEDVLKKREEFAVSLRKQKTSKIIAEKRRKIASTM